MNNNQDYIRKVGERIRLAREKQRYSQNAVAKAVGYKRGYSIYLIEKGKTADVSLRALLQITHFLGVKITDILS